MNTSIPDLCLQLGIFRELRSFSNPQVKMRLLIKWLKISFLNIEACWKSFTVLPPHRFDRFVWPTLEQVFFYLALHLK